MKKILAFANTTWYLYNFRMGLLKRIQEEGYELHVMSPPDDHINALLDIGVKYHPLQHLERSRQYIWNEWRSYQEIKAYYQAIQPDLVLQFTIKPNILGSIAARQLGLRCVSVFPGLGYAFLEAGWLQTMIKWVYRRVLPYNERLIFENSEDLAFFSQTALVPAEKLAPFLGFGGVDVDYFRPLPPPKPDYPRRFLFMARLLKQKGIVEYLDAARQVYEQCPDSEFWVIGHIDEDNPGAIAKRIFVDKINHPAIKYLGFKDDVRAVIRQVDCVVLPSYYREGVPRVLQEAMAMEKVIITTDTNGCRDTVEPGKNGFLIPPQNLPALVSAMCEVAKASALDLEIWGKNGRQKVVGEFSEAAAIKPFMELIYRLVPVEEQRIGVVKNPKLSD